MAFKTVDDIDKVLDPLKALRERYYVEQRGPLLHYDREMRCASKGCGSSTFLKVKGIPRCMTHALTELNEMLVALGVED